MEEEADEILQKSASEDGTTLRKMGILDERNLRLIRRREGISLDKYLANNREEEE